MIDQSLPAGPTRSFMPAKMYRAAHPRVLATPSTSSSVSCPGADWRNMVGSARRSASCRCRTIEQGTDLGHFRLEEVGVGRAEGVRRWVRRVRAREDEQRSHPHGGLKEGNNESTRYLGRSVLCSCRRKGRTDCCESVRTGRTPSRSSEKPSSSGTSPSTSDAVLSSEDGLSRSCLT